MKIMRPLLVLVALGLAITGAIHVLLPEQKTTDREQQKIHFQQAAIQAEPLIRAITAYTTAAGHPPVKLDDIIPAYIAKLPATGLADCRQFEYRSLMDKQGSIVWYDLGSRQGRPYAGPGVYIDTGNPDHAILVFTLDSKQQISSALIDRLPKGHKAIEFKSEDWKAGKNRIVMALALRRTYRLFGMPEAVLERLLGPPDGTRVVHGPPWELRIDCPTGLLNHDTFVYWPTQKYPRDLYGGNTESMGRWVYVHSRETVGSGNNLLHR